MHYYKHDHHTGTNPKWRGIAAERGVRPLDVYGIWNLLLEHASRQQDRGSVAQFSAADIAAQYALIPIPICDAALGYHAARLEFGEQACRRRRLGCGARL